MYFSCVDEDVEDMAKSLGICLRTLYESPFIISLIIIGGSIGTCILYTFL